MLVRSFATTSLTKKLDSGGSKMSMKEGKVNKVKRRSKVNDNNNPLSYSSNNNNVNNTSLSITYFGGL